MIAKEFTKDPKALSRLHMHRTSASYKLTHGLSKSLHERLVNKLKETPFSMNLDEATSSNLLRVFSVLVSYYSNTTSSVNVEHLASISVPTVDSEHMFDELKKLFTRLGIDWKNLMAILSDSASVMRGVKSGLEARVREIAPHLIDIDGDACHHMHNIVKNFTKHFNSTLEKLFREIYRDFKLSAHSVDYLKEICFHLGLTFRKAVNYISCRWLSILDSCIAFSYMRDAYVIYYSAYLKDDIQKKIKEIDCVIKKKPSHDLSNSKKNLLAQEANLAQRQSSIFKKHNVTEASKSELLNMQKNLAKKHRNATKKGKARKIKIIKTLLYSSKRVSLLTSIYQTVLPLFKSFVMLFQQEKPLIHKIYFEQVSIIKNFLSYFVKPDVLVACKTGKQLKKCNLSPNSLLPKNLLLVGNLAKKLVTKGAVNDDVVNKFLDETFAAYQSCGEYIQKKLPLQNEALKKFSVIDPKIVTSPNKLVLKWFNDIPTVLVNVLTSEEQDEYDLEVRKLLVDAQLPSALDSKRDDIDCLTWWISVSKKYPVVFKVVRAVLSIFHGPRVESSFSTMGDIIDKKSGRMNIETYAAIQTIKYALVGMNVSIFYKILFDIFIYCFAQNISPASIFTIHLLDACALLIPSQIPM